MQLPWRACSVAAVVLLSIAAAANVSAGPCGTTNSFCPFESTGGCPPTGWTLVSTNHYTEPCCNLGNLDCGIILKSFDEQNYPMTTKIYRNPANGTLCYCDSAGAPVWASSCCG